MDYVDISSNNATPDLRAYWAAGYRDLMLKATEGTGYAWAGMPVLACEWHSFGTDARVGYYHWLYGTLSGSTQYAWFWSHVAPVFRPNDWMMTDFEDVDPSRWVPDAIHAATVRQFDQLCSQHGQVHDYAPDWYVANLPACVAYFRSRPVVASDYSSTPPGNRFGLNHVAHQYTDRARVPGFPGPVDANRWLTSPTTSTGDDMSAAELNEIKALIAEIPGDVWAHGVSRGPGTLQPAGIWLADGRNLAASIVHALTDSGGILARVTALQNQVQALAAHQTTGGPGPVDLSSVQAELTHLSAQLSALSTHLGGTPA